MAVYKMTAKELILTSGSSRGSQIKFYKDNYWYKIDEQGPEGKAEELSSKILACSDLLSDEYIDYERCMIEYEGKVYDGCKSRDILAPGEQLLSYEKIYRMMTGKSLTETIALMSSPKERIEFTTDVIYEFCGLNVQEHIAKNLTASMVLMETDRHLNNIAIIADSSLSKFRNAPIFDNGAAFLSNYTVYPKMLTIQDIEEQQVVVTGKPFSADLEYQASEAGFAVKFDFEKIHELLSKEPESRMKNIANYAIHRYENRKSLKINSFV